LEGLRAFAKKEIRDGRPTDHRRFFFALRLAEAFSIGTGCRPYFDYQTRKRKRATDWIRFLSAALVSCALAEYSNDGEAAGGVDNLLRGFHDFGGRKKSGWLPAEIAHLADDCRDGHPLVAAALPSTALLINYADRATPRAGEFEPAAYEWFLPASRGRHSPKEGV
jgi:hypothetical protein